MAKDAWAGLRTAGGFLKPKHPKVAVTEQPADPLADIYGYVQQPTTTGLQGFMDQMKYINKTSPGAFMSLAAGLTAGDPAAGISRAGQELQQGQGQQQKLGLLARKDNMTLNWLRSHFDEETAQAAMANPDVLASLLKGMEGGNNEVFGTPIYGTDSTTGKTGIGTFDKQGNFHVIDTGDFEVASGVKTVETATEVVTINTKDGTVIAREPKNVAAGEEQKVTGKAQGEAKVLLKSMESKMPGLQVSIQKLNDLAKKATYTAGGQLWDEVKKQTGQEPREAAVARTEYIKMVDTEMIPLLRDMLGAQFTATENQMVRGILGDPDMHPTEKQAVLRNFIDGKIREIQAVATQAGEQPAGDDGDQEGDTATGPNGEKLVYRNGAWVPQ